MSIFNIEKQAQIEYLLYLLAEKNYRNGFPYYNQNYRKRRKLFKPLFVNTLFAIFVLKSIISLLISDDFYSLLIGDIVYLLDFKIQFHLMIINFNVMVLLISFINYMTDKNEPNFGTTHMTGNNRNESIYGKIGAQFHFYELLVTRYLSVTIIVVIMLFMLTSYPKTIIWMIIGVYWSIAWTITYVILVERYYWNLLYFLSFCYYSRHLLKELNQRLGQIIEKQIIVTNCEVLKILRQIDLIYKKIMDFNKFWSKICIVNWYGLAIFFSDYIVSNSVRHFRQHLHTIYLYFCHYIDSSFGFLYTDCYILFFCCIGSEKKPINY